MSIRSFRALALVRIVVLTATLILLVALAKADRYPITTILVLAAIPVQVFLLLRFVETTNSRIATFIQAITYSDFSNMCSTGLEGSTFDEIDEAFADVMKRFREVRLEREESAHFLRAVIEHVATGLIVFRKNGDIELMNAAAQRLLGTSRLQNLTALSDLNPELAARLQGPGRGFDGVIGFDTATGTAQLLVHSTKLRLRDKELTLLTVHNISGELEAKEMEAWQNLVRVFTHEIKNSLTPIASLASTVADLIPQDNPDISGEADMRQALQTIQLRSQGLLDFVNAYRELTRLPIPEIKIVKVSSLFARIETLIIKEVNENSIHLTTSIEPENLHLSVDPKLLEQVLLNLILNAVHALTGRQNARITLRARLDTRDKPLVEVADNGPGIVEQALPKIFVPFFSTKSGGTGIGLSLSRQIMRLHGGDLLASSKPGSETVFSLRFR